MALDQRLDAVVKSQKPLYAEENPQEVPKDTESLMDIVSEQREVIKALTIEIQFLHGGAPPAD